MFLQVFSAPNYVDQVGNKGAFVRHLHPTIALFLILYLFLIHR